MALYSVITNFKTTLAQGMTASQASMVLSTATLQAHVITPTDYGALLYITINPGAANMEVVRANTNSGTTFTLDKRGLAWYGAGDTELDAYKFTHNAGETVLVSNVKNVYDNLIDSVSDETIGGLKTFTKLPQSAATPVANADLATKTYVDNVALSGAPDANTTTKGIVEQATQAEVDAKTAIGTTTAPLFVNPANIRVSKGHDYVADTGTANAYIITPSPAVTVYATGDEYTFKALNANTTASTLNVASLGVKSIKKQNGLALTANDIAVGQIIKVVYDGTNMVIVSPLGAPSGRVFVDGGYNSTTVTSTTTTVLTKTIPANTFAGGNSVAHILIFLEHYNTTNAKTVTVIFGSQTIATFTNTLAVQLWSKIEIWVDFEATTPSAGACTVYATKGDTASNSAPATAETRTSMSRSALGIGNLATDLTFSITLSAGAGASMEYFSSSMDKI